MTPLLWRQTQVRRLGNLEIIATVKLVTIFTHDPQECVGDTRRGAICFIFAASRGDVACAAKNNKWGPSSFFGITDDNERSRRADAHCDEVITIEFCLDIGCK